MQKKTLYEKKLEVEERCRKKGLTEAWVHGTHWKFNINTGWEYIHGPIGDMYMLNRNMKMKSKKLKNVPSGTLREIIYKYLDMSEIQFSEIVGIDHNIIASFSVPTYKYKANGKHRLKVYNYLIKLSDSLEWRQRVVKAIGWD